MDTKEAKAILAIRFECWDLDEELTIGKYMLKLATGVWEDGERFSGKQPFGNSGWCSDIYIALAKSGRITGDRTVYDEENTVDDWWFSEEQTERADKMILDALALWMEEADTPDS